MKKALTIYIDDDAEMVGYCATFIHQRSETEKAVTMQNLSIPSGKNALYLPFHAKPRKDACFFNESEGFPDESEWRLEE